MWETREGGAREVGGGSGSGVDAAASARIERWVCYAIERAEG